MTLPGKPDIVFTKLRLAVFCDGDFWHGRNWQTLAKKLKNRANAPYWILKIRYNRERDKRNRRQLTTAGWVVLRFWETDILADTEGVTKTIQRALRQLRKRL